MTPYERLDQAINKAIPIEPGDCRIKKAKKEGMRLQLKKEILLLIAQNFMPKAEENKVPSLPGIDNSEVIPSDPLIVKKFGI